MSVYDRLRAVTGGLLFLVLLIHLLLLGGCARPPKPDAATIRAMEKGPGYAPAYPPREARDPNEVVVMPEPR